MLRLVGHVYVAATLRGRRSARVRFLVDTGATYGLIAPALARRAGLSLPGIKVKVRLATGRAVRVPLSLGLVRIDGREAGAAFCVGPCDEPLLGVEALESLGLAVDPVKGCLKAT
ncbi:MAG: retroviral-like aspartic protease family protein, partial [Deltaproteobacteria bacterium]|nr:retroviral-like aspartic protease family protein [Deltaproteobacteria bacterium]